MTTRRSTSLGRGLAGGRNRRGPVRRALDQDGDAPGRDVYRFSGVHDDGIRAYIDNVPVVDQWTTGNQAYSVDKVVAGGPHELRVEYFEASGGARAEFTYDRIGEAAVDTTQPSPPTGLSAGAISSSRIDLSWAASTDDVGVSGYRVERCTGAACTNFAEVAMPGATTLADTGLAPSTTYRYRVRATDLAGNLSTYSTVATATTPAAADTTPPTAPTGLSATAVSTSRIDLNWAASTDNVGVTGYRVERCQGTSCTNFAQVATPTATGFSTTGLLANTNYRFRVRAVDAAGNLSAYSDIVTRRTLANDTTRPTAPTGLAATAVSAARINLTWTASTDNVGVTGYRVERCQGTGCTNFAEIGTTTTTDFTSIGLQAATSYRFRVRAVDAAGNLSTYSGIAAASTPAVQDTTPPTVPTGLTATSSGSAQVNLNWSASTDDVAVSGYRMERCQGQGCTGFVEVATPTTTSYGDSGRSPSTTYRYRVRAVDASANLGGYSTIAEATTAAAAPTITSTSPASPADDTAPEVIGTIGAGSPTQVKVYENANCSGTPDASGTVTQFTGAGITVNVPGDATTPLSARASDVSDNDSACSNSINYTEDSTSPPAPQITGTAPNSPADDNGPEVKGSADAGSTVRLYESPSCGGSIEAQGSAASFASPGLTASVADDVTADFTATATDQAGNVSGCSAPFAYTEISNDSTPPSASLTAPATGTVVSGNATVSANAGDNVGVAGVQFLLDGAGLGAEDTTAPYSIAWDTVSASNGVHTLQARARDTAGNLATSSSATVTVSNSAPPPTGLVAGWGFNEGTGTAAADASGNGNTATLLNGPSWVAGKYGTGLSFDQLNDYLSLPNSSSLDISGNALTMSMWINPGSITGDSVVLGKFWNADMTSPFYQYGLELSGGKPQLYIGTASWAWPERAWTAL